jgi:group I intron endonuclease
MNPIAIYTITNSTNNKKYVGITSNIQKRWHDHSKADGFCTALHRAIKKYGKDNFIFEHIADAFNWENACKLEQQLIKDFNTKSPNGYNLTLGGDGTLGFKHTEEEKKRRSERCPTRNPEMLKIIADKQRGIPRPQTAGKNNAMYGRTGTKSHMLKHIIVATNLNTGEKITLAGAKEIAEAGFNRVHVYSCAKGIRKTHNKHKFEFKEKQNESLC